jgi:hypothetical protein
MALIGSIENQDRGVLNALTHLEVLVETRATSTELAHGVEAARREILAHQRMAERFVVNPLHRLDRLDAAELRALRTELDQILGEALRLGADEPTAGAIADFVQAARRHIEHQSRIVLPLARRALARGELPAVPTWYVDEVHGLEGGESSSWPEQWLG